MIVDSPLPDISRVKDVYSVPCLLAPFVAAYGCLYVYGSDITGHLFIERTERVIAGAEQFFRIGPKGSLIDINESLSQRARVYPSVRADLKT